MGHDAQCRTCARRPLMLLPIRYALGEDKSQVPVVKGPFQVQDQDGKALPVQGETRYTLRHLRMGHLYLYDEARNHWEHYQVSGSGYFQLETDPVPGQGAYRDPKNGHPQCAWAISIPEPENATRLWLAYSESAWTERTLKAHQDPAFRARHMRVVEVAHWLQAREGAHCAPLEQVADHLADLAPGMHKQAFWFSQAPFAHGHAEALLNTINGLNCPFGALVALHDPVGVATDLAHLMKARVQAWLLEPDPACPGRTRRWALHSNEGIEGLRQLVANRSEGNKLHMFETPQVPFGTSFFKVPNPLPDVEGSERRSPGWKRREIETCRKHSWDAYLPKYDEGARVRWVEAFHQQLAAFDQAKLLPLARMHVAWMESARLKAHLNASYDSQDVRSGVQYAFALAKAIDGIQDFLPCKAFLDRQLAGPVGTDNLLGRALLLNQKAPVQALKSALGAVPSGVQEVVTLPWDNLIGAFGAVASQAGASGETALARLILQLGGPLAQLIQKAVDGPVRQTLVALGMAAQAPLVKVETTGSSRRFLELVVKELMASHKGAFTEHQLRRAVADELRRLEIHGVNVEGSMKHRFITLVDPEAVKGMPKGLSRVDQARWVASSIRNADQLEQLNLGAWRDKVSGLAGGRGWPLVFGAGVALMQLVSVSALLGNFATTMSFDRIEAFRKVVLGGLGLAATVTEKLGEALFRRSQVVVTEMGLSVLQEAKAMHSYGSLAMKTGGKVLGGVIGVVVGIIDIKKGVDTSKDGDHGLGILYIASGVASIVSVVCFAVGGALGLLLTPIGWAAVLVAIAIGVVIICIKDDSIQDWLSRSSWGLRSRKYANFADETSDLMIVMRG